MKLRDYLNQFNRLDHAAEIERLCEDVPTSRVNLYAVMRGKLCSAEKAFSFMRSTGFQVDPRTFKTPIDWEALDAYYETYNGAASPFRAYKPGRVGDSGGKASAKPAGSGSGKGKAVAARSPARR